MPHAGVVSRHVPDTKKNQLLASFGATCAALKPIFPFFGACHLLNAVADSSCPCLADGWDHHPLEGVTASVVKASVCSPFASPCSRQQD